MAVKVTATYPFKTSKKRVKAAKDLLPVLRTLVAPIFPEPIFLTSVLPKLFVKISPKGIDPNKYEKKTTARICMNN